MVFRTVVLNWSGIVATIVSPSTTRMSWSGKRSGVRWIVFEIIDVCPCEWPALVWDERTPAFAGIVFEAPEGAAQWAADAPAFVVLVEKAFRATVRAC